MNKVAFACLMSTLLLGCGGGSSLGSPPAGTSADEVGARRVMQIFQSRHLRPRRFDDALSGDLFERLLTGLGVVDGCRATVLGERSGLGESLRRGDFSFPSRAASRCGHEIIGAAHGRALMFDAFAKAHDPHSAYLTSSALSRLRAEIHQPDPNARHVRGRVVDHGGARVAVMMVPSFYLHADRSTSRDAAYVLDQFSVRVSAQAADVLVLDMRGNTGGVQSEAAKLVGLLAGPGPIAQTVTADGVVEVLQADVRAVWSGPLVVVVDAMSASMTEVAVAALQDRGHALIVGQRTHGKGTGQTLVLLSSPRGGHDGAVRVTDRRFHRLNGRPLQRLGVTPNVELPTSVAIRTERDRSDALSFEAIRPVDAPPALRPIPPVDSVPFAAALSWLRTESSESP